MVSSFDCAMNTAISGAVTRTFRTITRCAIGFATRRATLFLESRTTTESYSVTKKALPGAVTFTRRYFTFPLNFLRNFATFGATTNEQ